MSAPGLWVVPGRAWLSVALAEDDRGGVAAARVGGLLRRHHLPAAAHLWGVGSIESVREGREV